MSYAPRRCSAEDCHAYANSSGYCPVKHDPAAVARRARARGGLSAAERRAAEADRSRRRYARDLDAARRAIRDKQRARRRKAKEVRT
jgi:hypothetical protein